MDASKQKRWNHRLEQIHFLPFLFFLIGFLGVVLPCVWPGYLPGDLGDERFNLCVLEHFFQVVSGLEKSFTDAPFFYPWPATIGYSDTLWGTAPIYALFRIAGLAPTGAFAAWFVIGNVLNFISAYFVLRRFGLAQLGAGLGAFLFAFGLPVSAQFGHPQLDYRYGVPLSIYFFHSYLTSRRALFASLCLLFLSLQILATLYIGIFLSYLLTAWLLGWCYLKGTREGQPIRSILRNLLPIFEGISSITISCGVATLAIALLVVAFMPYVEVHFLYGFKRDWTEIKNLLPRPQSYFLMDSSFLWAPNAPEFSVLPARWEHQMFLGSVALLAIFFTTFYERYFRPYAILFLMRTSFFLLVGLTLCVFGYSPYYIPGHFPVLDAVRAVSRIILVLSFPAGFMLGTFVEGIYRRDRHVALSRGLAVGLVLFCLTETVLTQPDRFLIETSNARVDKIEALLRTSIKRPLTREDVLVLASPDPTYSYATACSYIDAMLLSQKLGIKTLNGYSGNFPPDYKVFSANQADSVAGDLRLAKEFRKKHHLPDVEINPKNLILVGFKDVY